FDPDFHRAGSRATRPITRGCARLLPVVHCGTNWGLVSHLRLSGIRCQFTHWDMHHDNTSVCLERDGIRCRSESVAGTTYRLFEPALTPRCAYVSSSRKPLYVQGRLPTARPGERGWGRIHALR